MQTYTTDQKSPDGWVMIVRDGHPCPQPPDDAMERYGSVEEIARQSEIRCHIFILAASGVTREEIARAIYDKYQITSLK